MIEELNNTVWAKIDVSTISGVGVIAIRDIPKGQCVYQYAERKALVAQDWEGLHPEILKLIQQRWPLASRGWPFWSPNDDAHLPSFLNHSKTPNVDTITYCALRLIHTGEELTEDYGDSVLF
jgi:SET domain